jgi:hypothetical protein
MPIRLPCPGCGKSLSVKEELAGKRVKCPGCAAIVNVPPMARLVTDNEPARSPASQPQRDSDREFDWFENRDDEPARSPAPKRRSNPDEQMDWRDERDQEPRRPRPRRPLKGLEGLSPNYRIDLGQWYEVSGRHYGRIMGPAIGYLFVFFVVYIVVALLHSVFVGFLLDPVVFPALAMGLHIVCQRQVMGKEWSFGTFFSGFRFVWPLFARAFLMLLVPIVLALPFIVLIGITGAIWDRGPKPAAVGIFMLLFALATFCTIIYVSIRLVFFSHFLIVDRDCGPIEALKGSWILSRGHFWGLFGSMILILMCVYFVTFITLGIGMFFALPRAVLMLNAGYLLVAGSEPIPGVDRSIAPSRRGGVVVAVVLGGLAVAAVVVIGVAAIGISVMEDERQREDMRMYDRRFRAEEDHQRHVERERLREREMREEDERQAREIVAFFRDGGYWAMTVSERDWAMPARPRDDGFLPGKGPGIGPVGGEPGPVNVLVLGPRDMLKKPPAVAIDNPFVPPADQSRRVDRLREIQGEWAGGWRAFTAEYERAMARGEVEAALVEVMPPKSGIGGAAAGPPIGGAAAAGAEPAPRFLLPVGTHVPMDKAKTIGAARFADLTVERGWQ